ncbi:helix-turn-helix domain-containing protein [Phenylobacterium sp.]|uniref:TetR/AcrR family transcriptional regulator n=1 Tax=Phenylobacterium sp. TaxID=1871053 RepID=UPI002DE35221|nr:helix-turn-helix domain-containing protein [Phenylobacterium sp.]
MNQPRLKRRRRGHAEVRALILQAARELFAERGYAKATTRDIAKRAKASEVLLFRYFTSKAQLFEQAISEPFDAFMRRIIEERIAANANADPVDLGRAYVEALYGLLLNERQLILSLITTRAYESGAGEGADRPRGLRHYFEEAEASLRSMYKRRGVTPEVDPALGGRLAFASVVAAALLQDWLFAEVEDQAALPSAIARFVMHGLIGRE